MRGLWSAVALLLWGCSTTAAVPTEWTKLGAVPGQLETDIFVCRQWSGTPRAVNPVYFEQCMMATGWRLAGPSNSSPTETLAAR